MFTVVVKILGIRKEHVEVLLEEKEGY